MAKSKLLYGVTRTIARVDEQDTNLLLAVFSSAYEELRRAVPGGDLIICLQVETDSASEVGVVYDSEE